MYEGTGVEVARAADAYRAAGYRVVDLDEAGGARNLSITSPAGDFTFVARIKE